MREEDLERRLARCLRTAGRVAIVGVGDEVQPSDRLGMLAAREVEALRLERVRVFFGGTVPESLTAPIRRFRPDHVLFLDAVEMSARPGTLAIIEPNRVSGSRLSTHALPLSLVMEYLRERAGLAVTLVGLQPDLRAAGPAPTAAEQAGLTRLVATLQHILAEPRKGARRRGRKVRARTYRRYRTGGAPK